MYTSPSPDVAKGYSQDEMGRAGTINRVYVPENAAKHYYTNIGLDTPDGDGALRAVKQHSNNEYIFSGPQSSTNPDLYPPETVISPAVRDKVLAEKTISFEPSAHEIDPRSYKFKEYHNQELEQSKVVPHYLVSRKTADDCARDGGRERLAHVFRGDPPYISPNVPRKKEDLSEDDKLLLEECEKLGMKIDPNYLNDYKKELKSDAEYEREEDAENRAKQQNSNATDGKNSRKEKQKEEEEEEEEENDDKPPEPCKNHPANVRCMKCMSRSSGPRIRNIGGNKYGFQH